MPMILPLPFPGPSPPSSLHRGAPLHAAASWIWSPVSPKEPSKSKRNERSGRQMFSLLNVLGHGLATARFLHLESHGVRPFAPHPCLNSFHSNNTYHLLAPSGLTVIIASCIFIPACFIIIWWFT